MLWGRGHCIFVGRALGHEITNGFFFFSFFFVGTQHRGQTYWSQAGGRTLGCWTLRIATVC